MKWKQIITIAIVVGAGAVGAYYAFQPQAIGVDVAKIEKGTLVVTIDDEGIVKVKDTYQISTPIGGDVQRIPFIIGDHVEKGAIVASIEPQLSGFLDERTLLETQAAVRTAEAAVTSANTDVAGARSELRHWQNEANRTKQLMDRGLASEQIYEQALFQLERQGVLLATLEAALELRKRQLEQAQARLIEPNGSKDRLISYEIKAPASGQVLEIANESARSLPAGSHLLTIGDPANLEVIVALLSTLVLLFSFKGDMIIAYPQSILFIAIPLFIQTCFIFVITYILAKLLKLPYTDAAPSAMVGASNHFEVAIATAAMLFGLSSGAALATVVGVLIEVPVMLMLVKICLKTRKWFANVK